jgi:CheY-like chemotaxis protein
VLVNLLTNAAKYTDPGGAVTVTVREDGDEAVVTVADTGIGIPPDLLPFVFDLFVQDTRSLDRARGGLGIGLSVVRHLVEMHGGRVAAHSEGAGRGSTFELRLPLIARPSAVAAAPATAGVAPRRVLVVDDNVDAAQSLAMLLAIDGHAVECAFAPADALARAPAWRPDVVLLDIGLPGMDGYELAKRLRALPALAHTRIVAVTGYGQEADRTRSRDAGFDDHLVKPVEIDVLNRVLRDAPRPSP